MAPYFITSLITVCAGKIVRECSNDVIILGGRGFGKDDGERGCWAKDDVTFLI